jgi:hypothetical protein
MFTPISPAFEYVEAWFWPVMCCLCLAVGYIVGGIAQRG